MIPDGCTIQKLQGLLEKDSRPDIDIVPEL